MDSEKQMSVLLADDDASLRAAIGIMLREAGYAFFEAADGRTALTLFDAIRPDLVILDVMMGALSGFEVCAAIRMRQRETPVLFLSAKNEIVDKKDGFRAGGDDYLVKPFNEEELLLRVEALLKRARRAAPPFSTEVAKMSVGDLSIDLLRHEVRIGDKRIELTPKEFGILAALAEHPGEVFSREDLVGKVWEEGYTADSISIPVYVHRIREKIEQEPTNPQYLQTVWRVGYRLGD